jgi:hypothetical protein
VRGIREGIEWLREKAHRDDLVVVYISSHGSPRDMDKLGMSYIVTHESAVADRKLYSTSYQMVDLVQDLTRDVLARRLVLILDTCHSGGAIPGARSLVAEAPDQMESFSGALRVLKMGAGRVVISSSRADERSYEDPALDGGKGNGYFTFYFLKALRETKGLKSLKEFFPQVRQSVQQAVAGGGPGRQQTPVMDTTAQGGDLILGVETRPEAAN